MHIGLRGSLFDLNSNIGFHILFTSLSGMLRIYYTGGLMRRAVMTKSKTMSQKKVANGVMPSILTAIATNNKKITTP